jgi:hypothetical protein
MGDPVVSGYAMRWAAAMADTKHLDPTASWVLVRIAEHANTVSGMANPSAELVAAETRYSERAVRAAMARIRAAGIVECDERRGAQAVWWFPPVPRKLLPGYTPPPDPRNLLPGYPGTKPRKPRNEVPGYPGTKPREPRNLTAQTPERGSGEPSSNRVATTRAARATPERGSGGDRVGTSRAARGSTWVATLPPAPNLSDQPE